MSQPKIFVSYSHKDSKAYNELLKFLTPLKKAGALDYWADTRLTGGDLWRGEIKAALDSATAAVLLVSQDFLASDFIVDQEVPQLLQRAVAGGLTLIPVFLAPSTVRNVDFPLPGPRGTIQLSEFEGYGSPQKTLKQMTKAQREKKYTELADQLSRLAHKARPPATSPQDPNPVAAPQTERARDRAPEKASSSPRTAFLEEQRALAMSHLPAPRLEKVLSATSFERYSDLYRLVLDPQGTPLRAGNLFQALADLTRESPGDLLRIQGTSGTGKTTLLTVLYFYLLSRSAAEENNVLPFLLHLGDYDAPSADEAREKCLRDLSRIEALMKDSPALRFILLVDGFDEFVESRRDVAEEILRLRHPSLERIVGEGLGIDNSGQPISDWASGPALCLRSFEKDTPQGLVRMFLATTPYAGDARVEKAFTNNLERFDFSRVDLRTLDLLMRLHERPAYRAVNNLSDLLRCYSREILAPMTMEEQNNLLNQAAALAYARSWESKEISTAEQRCNRGWLLAHFHIDLNNYLVARHVVGSLLGAGAEGADLSVLTRIYPYRITRHAKAILTESPGVQQRALKAAERIANVEDVIVRTNVSYFLGRLTQSREKKRAVELLRTIKKGENEASEDREVLRLLRTIYVSLIYLGDREASQEYIARLIANPTWDHINRGFHLEYYGDISINPWLDFPHEDTMVDFPKTYRRLHSSIKNPRVKNYVPRELEIYTLFSLAQKRHAKGELKKENRTELLALLDRLLRESLESEALRKYLRMLQVNFREPAFSIGDVVEELYKIKEQPRSGWVARGLLGTESVADHMYGAFLLGLLFLPEKHGSQEYDKETVLRILLIHDLAEAYTGDIVSMEKREKDREAEAEWFDYISMLGTYTGIADVSEVARLWKTYESNDSLNAHIAHDLDRIDTFVQMHLYRTRGTIGDFEAWKLEIQRKVLTQEGRQILDLLERHFERKTPPPEAGTRLLPREPMEPRALAAGIAVASG